MMWWSLLLLSVLFCSLSEASVTYDSRAIIINGQRRILISGSIHYPRSTPEMWPDLIQKAKDGGLDVIQTYVFWNGHEPSPGEYYFEGRYDLVKFIKLAHQAGLYVHLRIGPYICAEWNFGGFPFWLKYVPGMQFRTDNEPFKVAMQNFTTKIVDMMKFERLFETQGGPIIMSQIENEYGPEEWEIGAPGKVYTQWAAEMAVGLGTGVPWVMCKQDDAPDPIINACNGFYCDWFTPNKKYKPKMWTENWTGWFTGFGGAVPHRPAEDVAYSVAKFIQTGGSFMNYYMFHGGTNFGRTAGGPFIATSYDYDAPIDEYGLPREPKYSHLRDLHKAIKLCEPALVYSEPIKTVLGSKQEAYLFSYQAGGCAAFLSNNDANSDVTVSFRGLDYDLPHWSISILPDCKNTVFNTARVGAQSSETKMTPVSSGFAWESFNEETTAYDDKSATTGGLLEQINVTRDASDYLWYSTDVKIEPNEAFLNTGQYPVLTVMSAGHALHVFINGQLSGTAYGGLDNPKLTFSNNVKLIVGINKIALLSVAVGLPNVGKQFETWNAGVLGPVTLTGIDDKQRDLTLQKWSYKVGLTGEALNLNSLSGSSSVEWMKGSLIAQNQPLTWYKTIFDAPGGNDPLALDMGSMGKGQVWINGQSIGRHWPAYKAHGKCGVCNYAGEYNEKKCASNCGEPRKDDTLFFFFFWVTGSFLLTDFPLFIFRYHVPRSWLNPTGNLMVIFEELGGNPSGITLDKTAVQTVCADIYEAQPSLASYLALANGKSIVPLKPKAHLWCTPGSKVSSIKFASFGTPEGVCGSFREGSCHAHKSYDAFQKKCIGQQSCAVTVSPEIFGGDPCPGTRKKLSVEAICT
ncbi:hypothetical protein MKW92_044757 [Papaver armeniacum]|nr:hypothetical protein MKW92_044757 [Papaver armeniacum]